MLTHLSVCAAASLIDYVFKGCTPGHKDVYFSFLPLAHVFECVVHAFFYGAGVKICFYSGTCVLCMSL